MTLRSNALRCEPVEALGAICAECGTYYQPGGYQSLFCGPACRNAWNNRRASRGADFYDLYMAYRFDRRAARELNVQSAMNRLASLFRAEDLETRDGRVSWTAPQIILERRPYLLVKEGRI